MKPMKQKAACNEVYVLNLPTQLRKNLSRLAILTGKPASVLLRDAIQDSYLNYLQTE